MKDVSTGRSFSSRAAIRYAVWSAIIVCVATPPIAVALVYGRVLSAFWGGNRELPPHFKTALSDAAQPMPKIATGMLPDDRARQIARLKSLSGRQEQASGAATALQIIAIAFDGAKSRTTGVSREATNGVDDDGYRRLSLDLEQTPLDAAVVVADQPIRWRMSGLATGAWPHVGFEGYAAFDVINGQRESLAGFRIGAFGATEIMRAVDPASSEYSDRTVFCAAAQKWADHFGLPFSAVRFALVSNPSWISLRSRQPVSDGKIINTLDANELDRLCKQHAAR